MLPFAYCVLNVESYLVDCAGVDERTLAGAFYEARAKLECFDFGNKLRYKFLNDGGVDEKTVCTLLEVNLFAPGRLQIVEM